MVLRALALCLLSPTAGPQTLVKDINTAQATDVPSSSPWSASAQGGFAFFGAWDEAHGRELWRTDGTAAGTALVKDVFPGGKDGDPQNFAFLGDGRVVSTSRHPEYDWEPWVSDGTAAGTTLLKDVMPGGASSGAYGMIAFQGRVYFFADDGTHGDELWVTDGTPAGTQLFVDLNPGPAGTSNGTNEMLVVGDVLYLAARSPITTGWDLYRTDGTAGGTVEVAQLTASSSDWPREFTELQGKLAFRVRTPALGEEVWISDGTQPGTLPLSDHLNPGSQTSSPARLYATGTKLYFAAFVFGVGQELYVCDGTPGTATLVKDIATVFPFGISSNPAPLGAIGDRLVFAANTGTEGQEPWITDGTEAGTSRIADLEPGDGGSAPLNGFEWGGIVAFSAEPSAVGRELFATDGAAVFPMTEFDAGGDSDAQILCVLGGKLLVRASDGVVGAEPWITDGSAGGTALLADVAQPAINLSSTPSELTRVVDRLYFAATDSGATGTELWVSDPATGATELVVDLRPGPASSEPRELAPLGDRLVFFATTDADGEEPWITDGTAAGTTQIATIQPGATSLFAGNAFAFDDRVIFTAADLAHGLEPWITDGTAAGTMLLRDIQVGPSTSLPSDFFRVGDVVFFVAQTTGEGRELWRTDGTPAGTVLVKDVHPGADAGILSPRFGAFQGELYFSGDDGVSGTELWKSDGTAAGTVRLLDGHPGELGSYPGPFHEIGGALVFPATDGTGRHPWTTDGTAAGTHKVASAGEWIQSEPISTGSEIVFFSKVGPSNEMLFRSDGSAAGTGLIAAVEPFGDYPNVHAFGDPGSGGHVVLTANDGAHGNELWVSDGSAAGTFLLADVAPGAFGSTPTELVRVANRLYFAANDGQLGIELHALDLPMIDEFVAEPFGTGCPGTGGIVPKLGASGTPAFGSVVSLDVTAARASSPALLLYGVDGAVAPIGGGCSFFVAGTFFTVPLMTDASGSASLAITPIAPMIGAKVYVQAVVVDPLGAWFGLASSTNGFEIVVGP